MGYQKLIASGQDLLRRGALSLIPAKETSTTVKGSSETSPANLVATETLSVLGDGLEKIKLTLQSFKLGPAEGGALPVAISEADLVPIYLESKQDQCARLAIRQTLKKNGIPWFFKGADVCWEAARLLIKAGIVAHEQKEDAFKDAQSWDDVIEMLGYSAQNNHFKEAFEYLKTKPHLFGKVSWARRLSWKAREDKDINPSPLNYFSLYDIHDLKKDTQNAIDWFDHCSEEELQNALHEEAVDCDREQLKSLIALTVPVCQSIFTRDACTHNIRALGAGVSELEEFVVSWMASDVIEKIQGQQPKSQSSVDWESALKTLSLYSAAGYQKHFRLFSETAEWLYLSTKAHNAEMIVTPGRVEYYFHKYPFRVFKEQVQEAFVQLENELFNQATRVSIQQSEESKAKRVKAL